MKLKQQTTAAKNGLVSNLSAERESLPVKIQLADRVYEGHLTGSLSDEFSPELNLQGIFQNIRTIIHDINNHMTTILGNADLGLTQTDKHDDIYENIETIKTVGSKIQDLLCALSDTTDRLKPVTDRDRKSRTRATHPTSSSIASDNEIAAPYRGRILVMDDKQEVRSIVGRILIRLGYEVDTAPDGVTTIEKYERNFNLGRRYDAVILDVNIPGGFGAEIAYQELYKIDPDVRAVVFSGCHNVGIMNNYDKFGFRGCVTKPFTVDELNKIIYQAIAG